MYKRGHDYDYQFDWVLKKQGHKIPEYDYADAKPMAGQLAQAQGKDFMGGADHAQNKMGHKGFIEERKENRALLGQQVMNGFGASG